MDRERIKQIMMYPFMQLDDKTEIVHSDILNNDNKERLVKIYIEKPIYGGFNSAVCYLPEYKWEDINGFCDDEIKIYQEILETTAHLIIRFARERGFENALNF